MCNYDLNSYIHLMPACEVVIGVRRALILNAGLNTFELIPLELAQMIDTTPKENLETIYSGYDPDNWGTIDSYLDFIISKGYAFVSGSPTDQKSGKPELYRQWDAPFMFTNAVIDFNSDMEVYYLARLKELGALGCDMVQIRFFQEDESYTILQVVEHVYKMGTFSGLSIVASAHCFNDDLQEVQQVVARCPLITEVILFRAKEDRFFEDVKYRYKVLQVKEIIDERSCGAVSAFYFATNIPAYSEGFSHNTCLNRKLGIDSAGNIKNCPSMSESFGNIKDMTLMQAAAHADFRKYWFLTKDHIDKCKACEFRRVCTDCRAFRDDPADILSAPLKCGYDPETTDWDDWSSNPLKMQSMEHYGFDKIAST